jgi:dTDP-4-dehydrorhamnose reductase
MKLLVVGRAGQVARALVAAGGREVIAVGRPTLDLERMDTFHPALSAHAPDVVACVGAYTAVDQAEKERDAVFRINAEGPGRLAEACARAATPFIYVSTDYVFDGAKSTPYIETDPIAPQGVYGASKAEGELRVAAAQPHHVILRTAWVYDATGKNFVRTMLRLARTRERVGVVADQFGAPTYAPHIAAGLLQVAHHLASAPTEEMYGVFHMSAADYCSWADFAEAIFEESARRGGPSASVDRITTAQYPTPAKRPANSRLDCDRIARVHGVRLPTWRQGLTACMDAIEAGGWALD